MAIVELCWIPALAMLLGALAVAGKGRPPPGWTEIFAPGVVAWVVGVQGLMFRRHPDYMLAYVFEARGHALALYCAWAALSVAVAWTAGRFFVAASRRGAAAQALGALLLGGASLLLLHRLTLIGSTIEFEQGIARPLSYQPAVRTILGLTAIASLLPTAGAILAVAYDGLREARSHS